MSRLTKQEAAWSLTEAANEPYFNLVQRYVFAPYFAGTLAASAAQGASVWGYALGAAGFAIAFLAPLLGSIADSGSRLKPWLAGAGAVAFVASGSLWFAAPGVSLLPVALAIFFASVAMELMNQFTNAFLPVACRPERMGLLSGLAFGFSQLAGIGVLLAVLAISANTPAFIVAAPNGVDRLAGPIAAFSILLFLVPFLLVAHDREATKSASVLLTDEARLLGFATGVPLGAPLSTPQEWGFMASGAFIAAGAAFTIAGMRTMMAKLAPPGKIAAYFGLYAFVGKATAFVGPTIVGLIASATGSVRPGIGVALSFLLLGAFALFRVRSPIRQVA
jgi:MFS-type transporter involved in bile tolerance (Atg22 family)